MPSLTRVARVAAGLALGLLLSTGAQAMFYTLEFTGASWSNASGVPLALNGSMVIDNSGFITGAGFYQPDSCTLTGAAASALKCSDFQYLDTDGFGTGQDFIGFNVETIDGTDTAQGFLWFADGSFAAEGVYALFTGPITNGTDHYGNFASAGSLTVSSTRPVPEPSALAMALAGAGYLAWSIRRRATPSRDREFVSRLMGWRRAAQH